MRSLHPVAPTGAAFVIAFLLVAPPLARSQTAPFDYPAKLAHVKTLVTTGQSIDAFSESVKLLRGCLATYGPSTVETTTAIYWVAEAVNDLEDRELIASMWELTRIAAMENLPPCDLMTIEATYECWRSRRRFSLPAPDMLSSARDAIATLDATIPEQHAYIGKITTSTGVYHWRRDLPHAIELMEAGCELSRAYSPDALEYCSEQEWLCWTLLNAGRHEEARRELQLLRDEMELREVRHPYVMGVLESTCADLAVVSGDWTTAEACYRRSVDWHGEQRRIGSSRFSERSLEGYQNIALAELKRGRGNDAWQSLQCYRGLLGKRLQNLDRMAVRSPATYARVLKLRKRVDATRDLRRQWKQPTTFGEVKWPRVLDELEANAELARVEGEYYASEVVKAVSLGELQSTLPENYAYIGWLACRIGDGLLVSSGQILDACWMYVVRARGPVQWIPLWENTSTEVQAALRKPANDYGGKMGQAASWTLRLEDDASLPGLAKAIAEQEFDPALPFLDGVDHLIVEFFEDRMAWKPLEALVLPNGTYVGDRFDVAYTPTADAFVAARRSKKPSREKVLIVGDPRFDPDVASSPILNWRDAGRAPEPDRTTQRAASNGDLKALKTLPALRYARLETECLHRIFPQAEMLCGVDATEANVRRVLKSGSSFSIIHFATHALDQPIVTHRHALALSPGNADGSPPNDGLLDAMEVQLEWNLAADLVTLSGCRTLDGAAWFNGEPIGLAGTMLGLGARSVLAASWNVDDLAAARLNVRFYENLTGRYEGDADGRDGRPMTKSAALREAKHWLRTYKDENGKQPFAHPIYWSGFVLIGDPE